MKPSKDKHLIKSIIEIKETKSTKTPTGLLNEIIPKIELPYAAPNFKRGFAIKSQYSSKHHKLETREKVKKTEASSFSGFISTEASIYTMSLEKLIRKKKQLEKELNDINARILYLNKLKGNSM